VNLPPQLQPVPDGTRARVRATFQARRIVFEPVAEFRAGEPMTFEFQLEATQAGNVAITAELSSDGLPQPLQASEQTEILGR
ncbi:MAG: hypothetical protein KDA42_19435, partial [Planctomycetales bacterium]|nr:hypothetical protein [Planctomycetales bacterium]